MKIIPLDWRVMGMSEAGDIEGGRQRSPHLTHGRMRPYLRVANVMNGYIDVSDVKQMAFTDAEFEQYRLRPGDILLNEGQSLELCGRPALYQGDPPNCCFQNTLIRFRPKVEIDGLFALQLFKYLLASRRFARIAVKTTSIAHLGVNRFATLKAAFPPLGEQRKIAAILEICDRSIENQEAIVTAKVRFKSALMQQLLTGRRRFKEFKDSGWRSLMLSEFLDFRPRVVTKPKGAFLAAGVRSHGKGVFLKPHFEAEDIALEELFQLRTNDLVLNITFAWEGAVAIVPPEADGALVSHRFPTFSFKSGIGCPDYFRHVIQQKQFVHQLGLVSPGGAGRNRVLSKRDFLRIRIQLPSIEEQRHIAAVLNGCDREINLLQQQLAALKEQKLGLLQTLLTGEIRVKVPKEA